MLKIMSHNINDVLYGSVFLKNDLELKILDHKLFQRLRYISQLGFLKYAFPSANHTRFEHSIGVMHLCHKMYGRLLSNQENLKSNSYKRIIRILENNEALLRLRLAALLHDVGHGPYSHASEMFTAKISQEALLSMKLPHFLRKTFEERLNQSNRIKHEWTTAIVIFYIFTDLRLPDHLLQDVLSILNKDISPSENSVLLKENVYSLLRDIISGEIDGDRMDYLQRDSYYTGAKYGIFDLNRILSSLYFSIDEKNEPHLALGEGGLFTFEDFLFSRYQMYVQIYLHKTAMGVEGLLKNFVDVASLKGVDINYPLAKEEWVDFHDYSFRVWVEQLAARNGMELPISNIFERESLKMLYDATLQDDVNGKNFSQLKENFRKNFNDAELQSFYFHDKPQHLSELQPSVNFNLKFLKEDGIRHDFKNIQESPIADSFSKRIEIRRIFVKKEFYEKNQTKINTILNGEKNGKIKNKL